MRPPLGHVHVYVRSTRTCTRTAASAATAAAAGHNCRTLATRRGTATSVQDTLANPARTFCRRGSFEPACVTMASAGGRGGGRGSSGGGGGGGGVGRASADERDPLPLGTAYDSRKNCSAALKHADDVRGGKGVLRQLLPPSLPGPHLARGVRRRSHFRARGCSRPAHPGLGYVRQRQRRR